MRPSTCVQSLALLAMFAACQAAGAPPVLPAAAVSALENSLNRASRHPVHVWRDRRPVNDDGTVNAYIEIGRGDRRKWEYDMGANERRIDRVMPEELGGYPVNYGFVPQTVSYDGDPFDALVLGPPLEGGVLVSGAIVGLLIMEDEKGLDSKVVLTRLDDNRRPLHPLTDDVRREIAGYFDRYKRHETGKFSNVPGWGSVQDGRSFVATTHSFFRSCRQSTGAACTLPALSAAAAHEVDRYGLD